MWSSSTRELFVKLYGHLKRKIKDHDIQARLHSNGKKLLCFSWHWGQMLLKLTDFKLHKPTSNTRDLCFKNMLIFWRKVSNVLQIYIKNTNVSELVTICTQHSTGKAHLISEWCGQGILAGRLKKKMLLHLEVQDPELWELNSGCFSLYNLIFL